MLSARTFELRLERRTPDLLRNVACLCKYGPGEAKRGCATVPSIVLRPARSPPGWPSVSSPHVSPSARFPSPFWVKVSLFEPVSVFEPDWNSHSMTLEK